LFSVPFGLAVVTRLITNEELNSVYAEVCLVQNWAWRVQAGQSMVFTDVTIIADRVLPIQFNSTLTATIVKELDRVTFGQSQ